ncbi:vps9 domain protein [Grosmannia clavigera kw1407]|uniref:Vps9 domain protein n=1 Tax=Grosmannia clavigera (strain kw1407 / UAMH 11150) TaxID=655863 RepID=F0XUF5_GROCL|nr:vps9 domain protein [Grosmannia clavigera kw1407]EFW99049.1 vps9 domain protein [Grosmannia clavigera kw1407]
MFESLTETFMAPAGSKDAVAVGKRPNPLKPTRSASRSDLKNTSASSPIRPMPLARSYTTPVKSSTEDRATTPTESKKKHNMSFSREKDKVGSSASAGPDTFENEDSDEPPEPPRASVDLDELPIELIGLADSFIENLQAKVHPTPPNIESLSAKFQEFYGTASSHIATHLAALATRQSRELAPVVAHTRPSAASILRAKAASIGGRDKAKTPPPAPAKSESEQQMITAEELADRKRQRRALEVKRSLMEEAVERRLCEGIYDRIYRHRSTQDEAQDDKLRSKTAALDVVGIGPADLGVDLGELPTLPEAFAARQKEVRQWLEPVRKEIVRMNLTHYPLGKLNRLKSAHKGIVDTLAHFHPSSSADEIMPMLIYALITLPPEQLSVVSDLNFVQRFRWETKIDGEAAYCLTNLEAAISFLDTVDLSTLRADEAPSGPMKAPGPETPKTETFPPAYFATQGLTVSPATPSTPEVSAGQATAAMVEPSAPPDNGLLTTAAPLRNRRLSDLVNTPAAQALSTASDAVLNTFSAADQGLKTIGNSLEGSYRLFFGRLQKQQEGGVAGKSGSGSDGGKDGGSSSGGGAEGNVVVPKTLEEARKLISTPPPAGSEDEASLSGEEQKAPSPQQRQRTSFRRSMGAGGMEDKLLTIVGGRKSSASRDHSADSARSVASSRRVTFVDDEAGSMTGSTTGTGAAGTGAAGTGAAGTGAGPGLSSFNPMSRFSGIGGFRGFGRAASTPSVPQSAHPEKAVEGGDLATAFPDLAAALPPKIQVAPPVKRFMEVHSATDLRISEVAVLLRDYQRLANALKELGGFRDA